TRNITEMVVQFFKLAIISEFEVENWYKTEETFQNFMDLHLQLRQELRQTSKSKQQVDNILENHDSGVRFKKEDKSYLLSGSCHAYLVDSRKMFTKNCRLYNEFLKSKGNVRVYGCVRPCTDKNRTTIQSIGENGELVIADPSIHTDDGHRLFKFNKVYDQQATKEEVFLDAQPMIRSVIDGYNVCIFTFGQSGWEKTNTK
ncbi:hypothetical protein MKX03_027482, partial [Papaver bracteatum]